MSIKTRPDNRQGRVVGGISGVEVHPLGQELRR